MAILKSIKSKKSTTARLLKANFTLTKKEKTSAVHYESIKTYQRKRNENKNIMKY